MKFQRTKPIRLFYLVPHTRKRAGMKFVAVSIALAGVASALPTPNATGLPFPLNATDISVPDYNTTLVRLQALQVRATHLLTFYLPS